MIAKHWGKTRSKTYQIYTKSQRLSAKIYLTFRNKHECWNAKRLLKWTIQLWDCSQIGIAAPESRANDVRNRADQSALFTSRWVDQSRPNCSKYTDFRTVDTTLVLLSSAPISQNWLGMAACASAVPWWDCHRLGLIGSRAWARVGSCNLKTAREFDLNSSIVSDSSVLPYAEISELGKLNW